MLRGRLTLTAAAGTVLYWSTPTALLSNRHNYKQSKSQNDRLPRTGRDGRSLWGHGEEGEEGQEYKLGIYDAVENMGNFVRFIKQQKDGDG